MPHKPDPIKITAFALAAIFLIGCAVFFLTQDADRLRDWLRHILEIAQASAWSFPIACGLYLLSSLVMFPIIALNMATAIVFGPVYGTLYALCGTLLSGTVFFYVGRFGRNRGLKKYLAGRKLSKLDARLHDSGVLGITTLRLVPLAPFGIFNMLAGVTSLRFADYIAGTFIAFWPGGIARAAVGGSLVGMILNPSAQSLIYLAGGIALWAAIVVSLHFGLKKFRAA